MDVGTADRNVAQDRWCDRGRLSRPGRIVGPCLPAPVAMRPRSFADREVAICGQVDTRSQREYRGHPLNSLLKRGCPRNRGSRISHRPPHKVGVRALSIDPRNSTAASIRVSEFLTTSWRKNGRTTGEQPHTIIETDHVYGQESQVDDCARGEPVGGGREKLGPVAKVGLPRLPESSVAGQGDGVPGAGRICAEQPGPRLPGRTVGQPWTSDFPAMPNGR